MQLQRDHAVGHHALRTQPRRHLAANVDEKRSTYRLCQPGHRCQLWWNEEVALDLPRRVLSLAGAQLRLAIVEQQTGATLFHATLAELASEAFSRDDEAKVYVQDRMREDGKLLHRLISKEGGHVYVCGGTSMGRDVVSALQARKQLHEPHAQP